MTSFAVEKGPVFVPNVLRQDPITRELSLREVLLWSLDCFLIGNYPLDREISTGRTQKHVEFSRETKSVTFEDFLVLLESLQL